MSLLGALLVGAVAQLMQLPQERSEWELFRALHEHGVLELHTVDPELAAKLRARVALRQNTLPLETRVLGPGDASDHDFPRVLYARVGGPGWEEVAGLVRCPFVLGGEEMDGASFLSLEEDAFVLGDERFSKPRDAFLLTREDPERPGCPLSIVVGGKDAGLAALYDLDHPAWRGALDAWDDGHPRSHDPLPAWIRGWGHEPADGVVDYLTPVEWTERERSLHSLHASVELSSDALLELRSSVRLGDSPAELERVALYGGALHIAGGRARGWLGARGEPARPLPVRLLQPACAPGLLSRSLGRPFDGEDGVYALLAPGQRDDGGAAFALACALAEAGEPAQLWLRDALGVAAARTWWGRPLEEWVGHLAAAGLALPVHELVDPGADARHSLHRLTPLRAFLFSALIARGRDGAELWRRGLSPADVAALETDFAAWTRELASFSPHRRDPEPASPQPLHGLALELAGRDDRPLTSLEPRTARALSFAREEGADALALHVLVPLDEPPERVPRELGAGASPTDVELTLACDAARALGLRTALVLEPLASPASNSADAVQRTLPEDWQDFFVRYERVALHYALLAELLGCELFCVGVDMPYACDVQSEAGHPLKPEIKRAGWERLLSRVRAAYGGQLTYAAGGLVDLEVVPFLERLDLLSVLFFPRLAPDGEPELGLMRAQIAWYLEELTSTAEAYGKPLLLLQTGFSSSAGAWDLPVPGARADPALQALLYEALAGALAESAWSSPWFAGLFVWELGLQPSGSGDSDARGFRVWGKPAEAFLSAVLGR